MTQASLAALLGQLVRYGVVGVLNNLLGYLIYVAVTWLWLEPKLAITLMYPVGALTGYFGHARYAFQYDGRVSHGLLRYTISHLLGYGADVGMLYVFADRLGYPHQIVQAAAIFVVGGLLFVLFRYFVFPGRKQPT
jgi:putative flippase GtrA